MRIVRGAVLERQDRGIADDTITDLDGPSGQRVWDNTAEGPYEIVCPGCGDDPSRDWSEISAELRRIRGIYGTKEGAEAALMDHIGMETR